MDKHGLEEALKIIHDCWEGKISHHHIMSTLSHSDDKILRKIGEEVA